MSNGKDHDRHGIVAAAAVGTASVVVGAGVQGLLVAFGTLFGALWLSPDLDLDYSRPYRRWGPLRFLWKPYAAIFSHRGVSHELLLGPLTRLLYLFVLALPVFWLVGTPPEPQAAAFVAGVVLGNWVHIAADRF